MFEFLSEESPRAAACANAAPTEMERGLSSSLTLRILSAKKNITVNVSGTPFCIAPSLFQQLENLGWYEDKGTPYLNANPTVFEIVLQFLLFESFPNVATLSQDELTELQDLVVPVHGLDSLMEHVAAARTAEKKRKQQTTVSFLRRTLVPSLTYSSRSSRKKQRKMDEEMCSIPIQEIVYPFAASAKNAAIDVDYLPNLTASYSTDSEDAHSIPSIGTVTTAANSVYSFNNVTMQFESRDDSVFSGKLDMSTKRRKTSGIFKGVLSSAKKEEKDGREKWTHEQWCASEYIL
jgi:hypothetical protein